MRKILLNIVGNAIKYTETGGVKIGVSYDPKNGKIILAVSDTGVGLTAEQISRLFSVFSQADESTTKKFGGTGLGLAISQRLATLLGGEIIVESRHKAGSVFTISISTGAVNSGDLIDALPATEVALVQKVVKSSYRGTILLAEDGLDNQRLICRLLEKAGLEVRIVSNGELAVDSALRARFDLILMDMQMPVMDGYTATAKLREAGSSTPIVACTADASKENVKRLKLLGCDDVLLKPFTASALYDVISDYCEDQNVSIDAGFDPEEFNKLRAAYVGRLVERMAELREAGEIGDARHISIVAHKLAGAAMFGLGEISNIARELDRAATGMSDSDPFAVLQQLYALCESVVANEGASERDRADSESSTEAEESAK